MVDLNNLVMLYKNDHMKQADKSLDAYHKCRSYEELIERAIVGLNADGERDSHKYRLRKETMLNMKLYLLAKKKEIQRCKSFDQIMKVIYDSKKLGWGNGFGPLWVYDTALAIGAFFNLLPDKVYLHSGALQGAKYLLGNKMVKEEAHLFQEDKEYPVISINVFPKEVSDLHPHHIENFLCIYKDEFKKLFAQKV